MKVVRASHFPTVLNSRTWHNRHAPVCHYGEMGHSLVLDTRALYASRKKTQNPETPFELCNAPTLDCRSIAIIQLKIGRSEIDHEVSLIFNTLNHAGISPNVLQVEQ